MVKFPQSSVNGHIDVSISASQRLAIQAKSGVSLTDEQWEIAESICEEYIVWSRHNEAHPDADEVKRFVRQINQGAKRLRDAIEEITGTGKSQAHAVASNHISSRLVVLNRVSSMLGPLHDLSIASKEALEHMDELTAGARSGPQDFRAWGNLYSSAARLFKSAGGNPTAYWSDHFGEGDHGADGGPFVDFVFELCECMPLKYRPNSKPALGAHLKLFLRKVKKRRGKSLAELV